MTSSDVVSAGPIPLPEKYQKLSEARITRHLKAMNGHLERDEN